MKWFEKRNENQRWRERLLDKKKFRIFLLSELNVLLQLLHGNSLVKEANV